MSDGAVRGLLGMRPRPVVTPRADRPLRMPAGDLGRGRRRRHRRGVGGAGAGRAGRAGDPAGGGRAARRPARRLAAARSPDGTVQQVEHGFHGFFRQYYTWRSVLRRIDPELGFLRPLPGYPVISRAWPAEDFASLPGAAAGQPARAAGPLAEPAAARPAAGGPGRGRDAAGVRPHPDVRAAGRGDRDRAAGPARRCRTGPGRCCSRSSGTRSSTARTSSPRPSW